MADRSSLVEIDPYRLDEHWVDQPKLYLEAADRLAAKRDAVAQAKAALELEEAELGLAVRKDPDAYGLGKVTDAVVKLAVAAHPQYTKGLASLNAAKYQAERCEALVNALEHRKRALENMVTLHGQSYYAQPKPKGAGRDVAERITDRSVFGKKKRK